MKPFVSLVITAYLEKTKPYLDLLIKSIENLDYPKDKMEVIIVSPPWYLPKYNSVTNVQPTKENYYNAHALNIGAQSSSPDAEYFFMLNDDVILTRYSLSNLVSAAIALNNGGIFMPIGNDQQGKYHLPVHIWPGPYRLDQVAGVSDKLMNFKSPYLMGTWFFETLCLYAVLVPRTVFQKVGEFDDSRLGQDDIDYTLRVRQQGFLNAIVMASLVFHAGGVSADLTMNKEQREKSLESFNKKWADGV